MGRSATLLFCPKCETAQPCISTTMGHVQESGIEVRKRRRECTGCRHRFYTAELPYRELDLLIMDRVKLNEARKAGSTGPAGHRLRLV